MKTLHKNSPLKSLMLASLLSCVCAAIAAAQTQTAGVDLNALTNETQKMSPEADHMALVWWIPEEYWQVALSQNPGTSKQQTEQFVQTIRPYVVFAVVDGKIGSFGGVTYKSEETVRSTIQIVDEKGTVFRPLADEKVDPDTRNILAIMKPILSNMMGKLGENMHFVVFPAKDTAGRRLADPYREGTLSLKLGADTYKWRLPLGSLMPPKTCPVDGEVLNGAWKFCPWHGDKLVTKP